MKWIKPSGAEIETNDRKETIEAAVSLGWQVVEDKPEEIKPKRKPRKAKDDGRNS